MRHPEFEATLAPAKIYPEIWRILLGLLLIVFCYISLSVMVVAIGGAIAARDVGLYGVMPFLQSLQYPTTPWAVVTLLATFSGMALGPILAAAALHFRGPGSLLGPWSEWWRGFVTAGLVVLVIFGSLMALGAWIDPPNQGLSFSRWLHFLPLFLPLLFLQIAAEELLFRGYIMQALAARFTARWIWFTLPALVFGLLHWDPEAGRNLPLLLLATFSFGLIAADLTERTGSLGAAMGFHFANNFLALLVLSIDDGITGAALYVSPAGIATEGFNSLAMALSIVVLFGIWWVIKTLLER